MDQTVNPIALNVDDIAKLIRPDATILDIGCNDGDQTKQFAERFPLGNIYAFEPDPRARRRFVANCQSVIDTGRVRLQSCAIGAINGVTEFYQSDGLPGPLPRAEAEHIAAKLPEGWDLSGSLRRPTGHVDQYPWCKFGRKIAVSVKRLDTWRWEHQIDRIDFIWADVQGAEIDLISGGSDALAHTLFFYTEYNNRELYEGQVGLDRIRELLGPDWEILTRWQEDVLFVNCRLNGIPRFA